MSVNDPLILLSSGLAEAKAARITLDRAITALDEALQQAVQGGVNALPTEIPAPTEHRREHRPGCPPKIAADPELQAFIMARGERMTFEAIAADVAQHFPEARRVGKSAIHDWWRKRNGGASSRPK